MKKNLIIVGPQASGKTTLANHLALLHKNPAIINYEHLTPFCFMECNIDTDIVVIETEGCKAGHLDGLIRICVYPIVSERRGSKPITINPHVVIVTQTLPEELELKAITNYYDFIFLSNHNPFNQKPCKQNM